MLQALIVVMGIALADSVNPSTVGPGVVLALSDHPSRRVLEFAAGAFAANFVAGALLVLGPGQWLLSLLPSVSDRAKHIGELIGGIVLVMAAAVVWAVRRRLAERELPGTRADAGSAFTAGATLTLVELPTAFPYLAAIAAIVGLDEALPVQLGLVALFNVVFLWPLLAIAVVIQVSASVRTSVLKPAAAWLGAHWPAIFASAMGTIGVVTAAIGASGMAGG